MAIIKFNKENLKPNKTIITEGIITGLIASLVIFILNFFGIIPLFNFIPKGFEVFALVFAAVYIRSLFKMEI